MIETTTHTQYAPTNPQIYPSRIVALILLVGGIALLVAAERYRGSELAHLAFFGFAVGFALIANAALAFRSLTRTADQIADRVFDAICEGHQDAAALTDMAGIVRRSNSNFELFARRASGPGVAERLTSLAFDPDALVYRILNGVSQAGTADEVVTAPDERLWRVSAKLCAEDNILWEFSELKLGVGANTGGMPEISVPSLVCTASGEIVSTNGAARRVLGGVAHFVELTGMTAPQPDQLVNGEDGEVYRAHVSQSENGAHEVLLLPVREDGVATTDLLQLFDAMPVALARVSPDGELLDINEDARKLLGEHVAPGQRLDSIMEGMGRSVKDRISDMMRGRSHLRTEAARSKRDGQDVYLQVTLKRLRLQGEISILAVISDATELKALEAQFVQSQKMQAIGQLAGGVAHDFNNLLTAINGHCDLLLLRHNKGDADHADLTQIRQNANRAASLVGQLLAFSRKQTLLPKVLDLYNTMAELSHLLDRLLGEKVALKMEHDEDGLNPVRVDERQIEQVIMNLVVNARDAMPNGGAVTIRTGNVTYDKDVKRDRATVPMGDYVQIDVIDTGVGIPEDQLGKIFEPFFTTKKTGEGTGLGLSTVYGIVKQTGGFIFAESRVGYGTTFTLLVPAHPDDEDLVEVEEIDLPKPPPEIRDLTGQGVVLLVEDELPVRSFAARALDLRGYSVIEAASAEEALDILSDSALHVDVFISDVIMPGMDGPTWVREALKSRPDVKVVFMSGYAEDAFPDGELTVPDASFLPKPFSLNDLTEAVKEKLSG